MKTSICYLIASVLLIAFNLNTYAQRLITVSADGTADFKTISGAIAEAKDGDIIDIYGTITGDGIPGYGIVVDKDLIIRGQGPEHTIIQASSRRGDPEINQRIFTIAPKSVVIIEHLCIRNGYLHGQHATDHGAGIQNFGHLVVNDCKIYGNFVKIDNDYHEGHIVNHHSGFLSMDHTTKSNLSLENSTSNKLNWKR